MLSDEPVVSISAAMLEQCMLDTEKELAAVAEAVSAMHGGASQTAGETEESCPEHSEPLATPPAVFVLDAMQWDPLIPVSPERRPCALSPIHPRAAASPAPTGAASFSPTTIRTPSVVAPEEAHAAQAGRTTDDVSFEAVRLSLTVHLVEKTEKARGAPTEALVVDSTDPQVVLRRLQARYNMELLTFVDRNVDASEECRREIVAEIGAVGKERPLQCIEDVARMLQQGGKPLIIYRGAVPCRSSAAGESPVAAVSTNAQDSDVPSRSIPRGFSAASDIQQLVFNPNDISCGATPVRRPSGSGGGHSVLTPHSFFASKSPYPQHHRLLSPNEEVQPDA